MGTALLIAVSVTAAAPARAQDPRPGARWIVNWAEQRCTLSRRGADEDSPALAVTSALGDSGPQLVFLNVETDTSGFPDSAPVEILLLPQGDRLSGRVNRHVRVPNARSLIVDIIGDDFTDRFARSESVALERDGRRLVEFAYPIAAQAIEALGACNDDLMASWGIDLAARRALSRLPQGNAARFITNNDYPDTALRAGEQGSVVIRLRVDPDGRVGECVVVASSGSDAIDRRTCSIFTRRVRYEPALDAQGHPVAAMMASRVTWRFN